MAPDGVPAEFLLVRPDSLVDEALAAIRPLQRGDDLGGGLAAEGVGQLRVRLCLLLHLPQRLDRVPVAIVGRVLEPAEQRVVDAAVRLLHHRAQIQRRRQLGEVEHPVDLPVAIVDVDRVLEQDRELGQRHLLLAVELTFEEREVALHLRHEPLAPPVDEMGAVHGQRRVEVLADLVAVGTVERDAGAVASAVLHRIDRPVRIGGNRRRVEVAVDVLGDPVGRERRPEPAKHVIARQPPAADLLEHGAEGMRAVKVVEDPEELFLELGTPLDREVVVAQKLIEDWLAGRSAMRVSAVSLPSSTR